MYWPGMKSDLTDHVSKYDTCSSFQSRQAKEPLIRHETADRPWQKVGADIFTLDGVYYLCVDDYYSSYFEVDKLENKTAAGIAKVLRKHFSVHAIPKCHSASKSSRNSLQNMSLKSPQALPDIPKVVIRSRMPSRQQRKS